MRYLLALAMCLACSGTWASSIGSVSENRGSACSIERGKSKLAGEKGASIESNDAYVTGACNSQLTFRDDTKIKVTENSRLVIDDFVYDPRQSDAGRLAVKVGMGTVRYASGQIAKTNSQQVAVKTPTATIAVRGTDFSMTVDESGQSLIILLPSCQDERLIKTYELQENKCRVGQITVTNDAGTVVMDQAFQATYVPIPSNPPAPPTLLNTIEAKINNELILAQPREIQDRVMRQRAARMREMEEEAIELESQRALARRVRQSQETIDEARLMAMRAAQGAGDCNPSPNICVKWDNKEAVDMQSRGKGVAFRITENEHYAEVKTQGYSSNTSLTIIHNDTLATELIGDGSPGGNTVTIRQNSLATRRSSR